MTTTTTTAPQPGRATSADGRELASGQVRVVADPRIPRRAFALATFLPSW